MLVHKPFAITDKEDPLAIRNRVLKDQAFRHAGYLSKQPEARIPEASKFNDRTKSVGEAVNLDRGFADAAASVVKQICKN